MKTWYKFICVILTILTISAGLPRFLFEDVSQDNIVDLQDAILVVKGVAQSAISPGGFKSKIERAVSTMNIAAGLKMVIKPLKDKAVILFQSLQDIPYLTSCTPSVLPFNDTHIIEEKINLFHSNNVNPEIPPPKNCIINLI